MAKKKSNKEIVSRTKDFDEYYIGPIDYEKLEKCIAKAISDENDKRINAYSATGEWMKFVICPVFWLISALSAIFGIGSLIYGWSMINTQDIMSSVRGLISCILGFMFLSVAAFAFCAGMEFNKETDRQFVVSVFSGMVSLVALIVAFIALFIEVR